jgi:hypothetical protein
MMAVAEQCLGRGVPLFIKQDSGPKDGQQGRIPDWLWTHKDVPPRKDMGAHA